MSWLIDRIHSGVLAHKSELLKLLEEGRLISVYEAINQIANEEGSGLGLEILLNFKDGKRLADIDSIPGGDVSIFIDKGMKRFQRISDEAVRSQVLKFFPEAKISPVGFGYEGFHADIESGRLTVLPGALHVWCSINERVRLFLDWIFSEVYSIHER